MKQKSGFTLIELSIVLVIIGLIVGGILTGQEMIRAAGIRATIGQLEKYNTAVYTFRNKYGYIPGDIPHSQAQAFGFYYSSYADQPNCGCNEINGNGNGILEAEIPSKWPQSFDGEVSMFWLHLSQSGLIEGSYGFGGADVILNGATATGGTGNAFASVAHISGAQVNELIPPAKMGKGNSFVAMAANGINYFVLAGINGIDGLGSSGIYGTNNLTPLEAYNIDKKIDDGVPATGRVFALDIVTNLVYEGPNNPYGVTTASANNCVNSGAYYISDSVHANLQNCSLRFNFQ